MREELTELIKHAVDATNGARRLSRGRPNWKYTGYVGAALLSHAGNIFTGINISLQCGIGCCAEHSAIVAMVKSGECRIETIVAATAQGRIIPPCGRCREFIYQVDAGNADTRIVISETRCEPLEKLLPCNWQAVFDQPL